MSIFISRNGETGGPYTRDVVLNWLANGDVLPTDLGCSDGVNWAPLQQVMDYSSPAAPPLPIQAQPQAAEISIACPICKSPRFFKYTVQRYGILGALLGYFILFVCGALFLSFMYSAFQFVNETSGGNKPNHAASGMSIFMATPFAIGALIGLFFVRRKAIRQCADCGYVIPIS